MTIPKIVHYVWVGPHPLPDDARARIEEWQRILPDYRIVRWSEHNIDFTPRFVRQAYGVDAFNRVANYVRHATLHRLGGIYLDHDVELRKSLDAFLGDGMFAGFQTMDAQETDLVNVAVLGAEAGHPLLRRTLDALDSRSGAAEVGSGTGPRLFTSVLRSLGPLRPQEQPVLFHGARLYPPRYFYPYEWDEDFDPACVTPDTVAIHRWAATWTRPSTTPVAVRARRRVVTRLNPSLGARMARRRNERRRGDCRD